MRFDCDDTIAAIATAPGGAARGVVRMSGRDVGPIVAKCFIPDDDASLEGTANVVVRGRIRLDDAARELNADVYLWPTHRSYTRQPVAEFHTVGSPPLLQCVLRTLCRHGARLAEPGEFTLRAFLAGRLDLTQAEAVLGVIDAHGPRQLERALAQLAGGMSRPLGAIRARLIDLLAELEAGLDFVDEDIEFVTPKQMASSLGAASAALDEIIGQLDERGLSGESPRVVLVGRPNVGKSSLFNALIQGDGALVADVAGTTRDYVSARLRLEEIECELIDTAGVDDARADAPDDEPIERTARRMSLSQRESADVRIVCLDAAQTASTDPLETLRQRGIESPELSGGAAESGGVASGGVDIVVLTRSDLAHPGAEPPGAEPPGALRTSSKTGEGLDALRRELAARLAEAGEPQSPAAAAAAARCREGLRLARDAVERARQLLSQGHGDELIAAELRDALSELGRVVGEVYTDDILDRIFSKFCIGK